MYLGMNDQVKLPVCVTDFFSLPAWLHLAILLGLFLSNTCAFLNEKKRVVV